MAALVMLLAGFLLSAHKVTSPPVRSRPQDIAHDQRYEDILVTHVYDGDTIRLADGQKVRLIGIDTPESRENRKISRDAARSGQDVKTILAMGRRASDYTASLLAGQRVRLEFDIEKRDKYGRLLAYVYRLDDGLFINAAIIKNGYAYPMTIPPNIRHADEFRQFFNEAQKDRRGLWADT